jgi:hypothetical protein
MRARGRATTAGRSASDYVVRARIANAEGRFGTSFRFWDADDHISQIPRSLDPKT